MTNTPGAWAELAGRSAELVDARAFLARARENGAAVALGGPTGVGKTTILSATSALAREDGFTTLAACGVRFESEIDFAGLNQLLAPLHRTLDLVTHDAGTPLAAVVGRAVRRGAAADAVADAVIGLLQNASPGEPVLVCVDDLQWIDRSTRYVLEVLARGGSRTPLALLVAYASGRPADLTGFTCRAIEPLDGLASAELLERRWPDLAPRARARVLDEAAGLPLLLEELPSGMTVEQRADRAALPYLLSAGPGLRRRRAVPPVPAHPSAKQLLLLAALDAPADLSALARALGCDVATLQQQGLVEEVVSTRIVSLTGSSPAGARLEFADPLDRLTIVEAAAGDELRSAHAALARAHGDDLERCARHLAVSATAPDEYVACRLAELSTGLLAQGKAAAAFEALVAAGEFSATPEGRRLRLAGAAYLGVDVVGNLPRSAALLDEVRQHDASSALAGIVAAAKALFVGDAELAAAHQLLTFALRSGVGNEDEPGSERRLAALYSLYKVCFFGDRPELWPPLLAAADQLGPRAPLELQLMVSVLADPARATDHAREQLDVLLRRDGPGRNPATIERLATVAVYLDRAHLRRDALQQVVADGRAGGAVTSAVHAAMALWGDAFHAGDWAAGEEALAVGLELCARYGLLLPAAPLTYGRGLTAAAQGRYKVAEQAAELLAQWSGQQGLRTLQRYSWHVRALAACGEGDYAGAHLLFRQLAPDATVPRYTPESLWSILELVESAVHSGHRDYALAYVDSLHELGVERISPRLDLVCSGARALVAEPDGAGAAFNRALERPGTDRWPFDSARIRLAYGEYLRRRRSTARAREQISTALETFRLLGAEPWIERALGELRATGTMAETVIVPAHARHGLTPQERKIATLVAAGLTNKQIAERLKLSPRTVGAHLRQVFPKLGIRSRAGMRDALDARAEYETMS